MFKAGVKYLLMINRDATGFLADFNYLQITSYYVA